MTYKSTHPWITFDAKLDNADMKLWVLAGEVKAKCDQIANLPLKPAIAATLALVYLTKGVKGTTAIEGNTLTEEQVKERIEGTLTLPQSQEYLGKEVDNIVTAINQIATEVKAGSSPKLTPDLIKHFNKQVLHDLTLEQDVVPGEIPKFRVVIFQYRGAPREECEYLLQRLCDWLNSDYFSISNQGDNMAIITATMKAIVAHLYIAWIHPFGDGNGRTARLVEFLILFSSGVPDIAAHLLSNHYNSTRTNYYKQLDDASKSGGNILPFLEYALEGFVDGLIEQLTRIKFHQWTIAWQNFVHDSFQDKNTKAHKRRRDLVLVLSTASTPVPLNKILDLSSRLALAYARLHPRTLTRDLNVVIDMDLVTQAPDGYSAKKEKILAFLPFSQKPID